MKRELEQDHLYDSLFGLKDNFIKVSIRFTEFLSLDQCMLLHFLMNLHRLREWKSESSETGRTYVDGWSMLTEKFLEMQLKIPRKKQGTLLLSLSEMGLIEVKRMGMPPFRYFRPIKRAIYEMSERALKARSGNNLPLEVEVWEDPLDREDSVDPSLSQKCAHGYGKTGTNGYVKNALPILIKNKGLRKSEGGAGGNSLRSPPRTPPTAKEKTPDLIRAERLRQILRSKRPRIPVSKASNETWAKEIASLSKSLQSQTRIDAVLDWMQDRIDSINKPTIESARQFRQRFTWLETLMKQETRTGKYAPPEKARFTRQDNPDGTFSITLHADYLEDE